MSIDPIASINGISSLIPPEGTGKRDNVGEAVDDFSKILGTALNSLAAKENTANQAIAGLAAGEDIELHQVMVAMQEADISFQLALQVRNKIIESYQEVMRLQV